jgi:hypothetical protein
MDIQQTIGEAVQMPNHKRQMKGLILNDIDEIFFKRENINVNFYKSGPLVGLTLLGSSSTIGSFWELLTEQKHWQC